MDHNVISDILKYQWILYNFSFVLKFTFSVFAQEVDGGGSEGML
jgi:hypothetical protein